MSFPMQIGAAVVDSRSNMSDLDEDYNPDKIITHEMYDTKQANVYGKHMVNSEVVAYESVERILNNVSRILYEKYINSKLDGHTIESTYDLVELLFSNEFIAYDDNAFVGSPDAEPPLVPVDNWGRSKIGSKQINKVEAKTEFNDHAESMLSEDKKALQKAKDMGKRLIRDAKGDNMPAPLDLHEPAEVNKTEDDLRQVKERERRRQDEEKAIEQQKRKAENQAKFKTGNADLKKKPFTYDYNGVPIIITNAKVEKFPPSAYQVQHMVQDPEVDNTKDKRRKTVKDIGQIKSKQKKAPESDQDFAKKFGLGAPTYDLFEPQVGVTYEENGKKKNSTKSRFNMTSVTSGSLISSLGANPRLTRTEYLSLTKGGNLSRTNLGEKENPTMSLKPAEEKRIPLETVKEQWNTKTGAAKDINFNTTGALRMAQQYKDAAETGIHFDPNKLETLIKASEEIKTDSLQPPKQIRDKYNNTDDILKKSPVDTFNMELMSSKDWGKNTYSGSMGSLPKLPQNKTHLEQSLGAKSKYPRYRTSNIPTEKNYTELLMQTIKSQQIS